MAYITRCTGTMWPRVDSMEVRVQNAERGGMVGAPHIDF